MQVYWPKNMRMKKSFQKYLVPGRTVDFLFKKTSVIPGTKNGVFRFFFELKILQLNI